MTDPGKAVFLSYASQDKEAALHLCNELRAAGIEVWFDQSELRGGDAWDASIRRQIKSCALFVPIISRNTHDRVEGYFRLEWKLAVDRSHLIATDQAFLLPVVIDDTRDDDERVPDRFRDVQWTRLPGGQNCGAFADRVHRLLAAGVTVPAATGAQSSTPLTTPKAGPSTQRKQPDFRPALSWVIGGLLLVAAGYFAVDHFWLSRRNPDSPAANADAGAAHPAQASAAPSSGPAAFSPPPHSIAVLPFANLSGDKDQEYFSDGLSEELLNALARISDLHVAARSSSFSFKGTHADLATIAHKLNVGAILEGSVRRAGHTVRVTAQLSDAVSGYQLWSHEYDKSLTDVFKVQASIADDVASALKVTLLQSDRAALDLGGTRNPQALDLYLEALPKLQDAADAPNLKAAVTGLSHAIDLDPSFALAYAQRSLAWDLLSNYEDATTSERLAGAERSKADALRAVALAPQLPEGHAMLGNILLDGWLDFSGARQEYEKALALGPSNTASIRLYSVLLDDLAEHDGSLALAHKLIALDPLNFQSYRRLGYALLIARQYDEAVAAFERALKLKPDQHSGYSNLAELYLLLGQAGKVAAACKAAANNWECRTYLAIAFHRLGERNAAEAVLHDLLKELGETGAYQYSYIYAQWGDKAKALHWLEKAWAIRDAGLTGLKTEPLFDPIRSEPRFQAVLKALKFPS